MSEIDEPHAALRRTARDAEIEAARKTKESGIGARQVRMLFEIGRLFDLGGWQFTSKDIDRTLKRWFPCSVCGCEHRSPLAINVIGTRLQKLREDGFLTHVYDDEGKVATRDGAELHTLTDKGRAEPRIKSSWRPR